MATDAQIASLLAVVAPAPIAEAFAETPARCIVATAIGLEALRFFGVKAEPFPVGLTIYNAALVQHLDGGGVPGARIEGGHVLTTFDNQRQRIITRAGRPYWRGHLVIHLPAARALVDLDLQQLRRPEKGISVPDAAVFNYAEHSIQSQGFRVNGCMLRYMPSDDQSWRTSSDWRSGARHSRDVIGRIIREMKAAIEEGIRVS